MGIGFFDSRFLQRKVHSGNKANNEYTKVNSRMISTIFMKTIVPFNFLNMDLINVTPLPFSPLFRLTKGISIGT